MDKVQCFSGKIPKNVIQQRHTADWPSTAARRRHLVTVYKYCTGIEGRPRHVQVNCNKGAICITNEARCTPPALAQALIVDGTNLRLLSRADAGFDTSHADAFAAWLSTLCQLISCKQLFVVFDNKHGEGKGTRPSDIRAAFVPSYLQKRHAKAQLQRAPPQKAGSTGDDKAVHLPQQQRPVPQHRQLRSGVANGSSDPPRQYPGKTPAEAPSSTSGGPSSSGSDSTQDLQRLARAAEALMHRPPIWLAPFVDVVRQLGGLAVYGLPGFEADDMIASLVAGLLAGLAHSQDRSSGPAAMSPSGPSTSHSSPSRRSPNRSPTAATPAGRSRPDTTRPSPSAPATPPQSASTAAAKPDCPPPKYDVVVASSDSDMLQLLAFPGCAWLEVRQLSTASCPQEPPPVDVRVAALPGIPRALMQLYDVAAGRAASAAVPPAAAAAAGPLSEVEDGRLCAAGTSAVTAGISPAGLPPAVYPDYLALVGKVEAGVPGVGIGKRSARKLLARYGSLDGILQAYDAGELLDAVFRPAAKAGSGAAAVVSLGSSDMQGNGAEADAGPKQAALCAAGGRGGAGCYPPALQQALRNLAVTRMYTDVSTVPWKRIHAYCQQPRLRVQQQHQHALATLHPQDALHVRSAAPYVAALASALRARGDNVSCLAENVDEEGQLSDLLVLLPPNTLQQQQQRRLQSPQHRVALDCGQQHQQQHQHDQRQQDQGREQEAQTTGDVALLRPAAVDAVAVALLAELGKQSSGDSGTSRKQQPPRQEQQQQGASVSEPLALRVCVLAPWDFAPPKQASVNVGRKTNLPGAASHRDRGSKEKGGSSGAMAAAEGMPAIAGGATAALTALAEPLQAAVGCRRSLTHVPPKLQAALRHTTAWRLKRLQRTPGGVAVVPFYELMLVPPAGVEGHGVDLGGAGGEAVQGGAREPGPPAGSAYQPG